MPNESERKIIHIGDVELNIEIADTLVLKTRGLSNRDNLDENSGMLFVYDDKQIRNFWMKDVRFPIDILWINDGIVVGIQENIPHKLDNLDVVRFKSNMEVSMVLEVNKGWIAQNGIKTGDRVDIIDN
jgi:uncharacterized protein